MISETISNFSSNCSNCAMFDAGESLCLMGFTSCCSHFTGCSKNCTVIDGNSSQPHLSPIFHQSCFWICVFVFCILVCIASIKIVSVFVFVFVSLFVFVSEIAFIYVFIFISVFVFVSVFVSIFYLKRLHRYGWRLLTQILVSSQELGHISSLDNLSLPPNSCHSDNTFRPPLDFQHSFKWFISSAWKSFQPQKLPLIAIEFQENQQKQCLADRADAENNLSPTFSVLLNAT